MSTQATREAQAQAGVLAYYDGPLVRVKPGATEDVRKALTGFLDAAATATGRQTFYNSAAEQAAAEEALHQAVWVVNRGLYAAALALPGVQDRAVAMGLVRLLDNPGREGDGSFLNHQQETGLIGHLAGSLPPQRLFKFFGALKKARINNRRTRSLILRSIVGAGRRLPFWAVKYRDKLREALRHALGSGVANGIKAMTATADPRASGVAKHARFIDRYLDPTFPKDQVYQCLHFILGGRREGGFTVPQLAEFYAARQDLSSATSLPVEVLDGIRSTFHKDAPRSVVLETAKGGGTLTEGQKMAMQRSAAKSGVELAFDPTRQELVKLYVYALETGDMTAEIRRAMDAQSRQIARDMPLRYGRVAIVLDTSLSMSGAAEQKHRPLAVCLALRDVLCDCSGAVTVLAAGEFDAMGLVHPAGDTSLATLLVQALKTDPDAVYLLSDGYENAPEGRVDEVLRAARALGVMTPVYQLSPVLGAETAGVRRLSSECLPLPVSRPEGLGLSLLRAALTQDIEHGIAGLLNVARGVLGATNGRVQANALPDTITE